MDWTRRQMVESVAGLGLATWLAAEFGLDALGSAMAEEAPAPASSTGTGTGTGAGILRLRLGASGLAEMGAFYSQVLGWPVRDSEASLVVQAGGTEIRFDAAPAASKPYHHIAWAIPSNQFLAAKAWLARRTPLLRAPDGRDEFHFSGANRRAVYFADPAANILELIARDDVGDRSEGPFGLENILFVNHFGLVVQAMAPAVEAIRSSLKLAFTAPPLDNFAKLGDAHRHLVLVPQGRIWIPEMKRAAEIYPAEAVLAGDAAARLDLPGHPYSLALEPAAGAAQAAAASS